MKHLINPTVIIACLVLSYPLVVRAEDQIGDLKRRIEELEARQESYAIQASERPGTIRSFLSDNLTLGGFFEPAFTFISGPATKTQAAENQNLLGINLAAEFSSHTRFVSQNLLGLSISLDNAHSDSRATLLDLPVSREFRTPAFGALITQGYLEYTLSEGLNFQTGIGYAPVGSVFQQREPVLFVRQGGPQMLRTAELVSPLWLGVHIYGRSSNPQYSLGYNVYTTTSVSNLKVPGIGTRIWWASAREHVNFGISGQATRRKYATTIAVGTDLQLRLAPFAIRTELLQSSSPGVLDPWSFYIEPTVAILEDEFILYTFLDYTDHSQNKTGMGSQALADPLQKWEAGGGLNWLPTSFTRIRAGITAHRYVGTYALSNGQNRDYLSVDLSAGVAF